ncbi:MAG: DUF6125 family protein [Desulfomonile sp.]
MTGGQSLEISELSKDELLRLMGMFFGHVFVHYGMWFTETLRREGIEKALELESQVLMNYFPIVLKRLSPHFGIEMDGDVPVVLSNKAKEDILSIIRDLAKTWVTGDGLWFQAIEHTTGIHQAKQINDTCWSHFANLEAHKILHFLKMPQGGGLNALERSLELRMYSTINAHRALWEPDGSLLFTMAECRVQKSRRRKNMDDYECKSAGLVEYSEFAHGVDRRIQTQCVYCPPDPMTPEEFCSWRFRI